MLSSRALLFPSVWPEPFGRVIAEAMAAGLPVLGSPVGGAAELLASFGPGWSVPPGDVDAWVEGLARLESDDAVDAAGVTGRAYYQAKLDADATLAALLNVYRTAAAKRASERPGSTVGA
jgi:glycosyltransferase involved in cell wall biosynthesis